MDGCLFKESKWRKNTCATCFQLKSAHGNVQASPTSPRSPSARKLIPRSESWDGKKAYSTLPNRNSNRSSTSSIGSSSTLHRSNSSSSAADVSESSVNQLTNELGVTSRPTSLIDTSSNSIAYTPGTHPSDSSKMGEQLAASASVGKDTSKNVAPKPPTARKPNSIRSAPPRPTVAAEADALNSKVSPLSSSPTQRRPTAEPKPPARASVTKELSSESLSMPTSESIDSELNKASPSSSTSTAVNELESAAPRSASGSGAAKTWSAPRANAPTRRSPPSPAKSAQPPLVVLRSGSARRPTDEKTLVSATSSTVSTVTGAGAENDSARSQLDQQKQKRQLSSSSTSSNSARGGEGDLKPAVDITVSSASAGSSTASVGLGSAASPTREHRTVAMDALHPSTAAQVASGGIRGDTAAYVPGNAASSASSSSSLQPSDPDSRKKGPAKPSRSKVSYTASPDLLRAHASKTDITGKSDAQSPVKGAYEDIWTAGSGISQTTQGTSAKPQAKSRTLSPSSSDLDKMVSGNSTDLDVIVSGKKRPSPATRKSAKKNGMAVPSPGDTNAKLTNGHVKKEQCEPAAGGSNANRESHSVPGEIRPLTPDNLGAEEAAGNGEFKAAQPAGVSLRPSSSSPVKSAENGVMLRATSEVVVSHSEQKPVAPKRSMSRPSVSKPEIQPPPPPSATSPNGGVGTVRNGVTLRKPSISSDDNSPSLSRGSSFDRSKRHTISGRPNRIPPPPPPEIVSPQDSDFPVQDRRSSSITTPPLQKKNTGSGTAPASLDMLMKSVNDAGHSVSRLSPKIGSKVWKNLRRTHDRTMSLIRQHKPKRKTSQNPPDTDDDDGSPFTSREHSRAPSTVEDSPTPDVEVYSTAGEGSPETPKATPPRKPLRTATSFKRTRRNTIDASMQLSPTSGNESQPSTLDRASSNDTTASVPSDCPSTTSTLSLRELVDSALADGGESTSATSNTLPLPPKPTRHTVKPDADAPALPPRTPTQGSSRPAPAVPSHGQPPAPLRKAKTMSSMAAQRSTPSPLPSRENMTSTTPTPPPVDSEVERELSLLRSDYHALTRSSYRGLSNVVKRLSRSICSERPRSSSGVPKNWSQIEVLGCEDDGPHGTCSIHIVYKGRGGKTNMTAQLEPLMSGNDDDSKLYSHDCDVRALLSPHVNIIRTQGKFNQPVPDMVREMLELEVSPTTECACYVTDSTADYVDAEIFFSSLMEQDVPSVEAVNQTAFIFVQICLALQHLAASGVVHRNILATSVMIGPVTDSMLPIRNGDHVLLTSFGHAMSLPESSQQPGTEDLSPKLIFKRSAMDVVDVRRSDILPPEIRLNSRSAELDYSGCDAYAVGMLMRSVVDCSTSTVLKRICDGLCASKQSERLTISQALAAFQSMLWGPSEAEVPGWTNSKTALDKDRLCAWLDIQRSERLGVLSLKLSRYKISLEDYYQCSFLVNVDMDNLIFVQEKFFSQA